MNIYPWWWLRVRVPSLLRYYLGRFWLWIILLVGVRIMVGITIGQAVCLR